MIDSERSIFRQMIREEVSSVINSWVSDQGVRAPKLLTEEGVANMLGIKRQTCALWRSLGKGPNYKRLSGGAIRYSYDEVMRWIEERTVKTQ